MLTLFSLTLIMLAAHPALAQVEHAGHAADSPVFLLSTGAALTATALILRRVWRSRQKATAVAIVGAGAGGILTYIYVALERAPFARHMLEQMILMDAAAPLIAVIARRWFRISAVWATAAHAAVMWGWHVPTIYTAVNANTFFHALMQISFLLVGIAFWASILRAKGSRAARALFWLFMTVMHTGFLGALLTFTEAPLYGASIQDQHLGGAVMWVMGTAVYALAGLLVAARWFSVLERGPLRERAA